MKLNFLGDIESLSAGIEAVGQEMEFTVSGDGIPIMVKRRAGDLVVAPGGGDHRQTVIEYDRPIHFFRGLSHLVSQLRQGGAGEIREVPQFDMCGVMLDCSRNGVLKVETIKQMLRSMAIMGLDMLMLYTEDTYTLEDEPYFGYMRGRYSHDELKECDDYAWSLGIEMIPCMQTLAHMEKFFRWSAAEPVRDTMNTLLVDEEQTYAFITRMIAAAAAPFRTDRIHIGMDEASDVGLGNYLRKHGYQEPFSLLTRHLKRVVEITDRQGLRPIMWSDMFFKFASPAHASYDPDTEIPESVMRQIPDHVQQVYWRYGLMSADYHRQLLRRHKQICDRPVFAGGVLTWGRFGTHYATTLSALDNALTACKQEGIRETMVTLWADDGHEGNYFSGLLGLQHFAEHCYTDELSRDTLAKRIVQCTGIDYQAFLDLTSLNHGREMPHLDNLAKTLLWQDILLGLFDVEVEEFPVADHFQKLTESLEKSRHRYGQRFMLFAVPFLLSRVLQIKGDLGIRMKAAYDRQDRTELQKILELELPELKKRIAALRDAHREQWMELNKPFGWEVLDIRYGGLAARVDSVDYRLRRYLDGEVSRLDELEEERLPFADRAKSKYRSLASPCMIT